MFLQNKYTKWYNQIIENAKSRDLTGYRESHHIIPKSFGGSDDPVNIVDLTAREHFICHLLLLKMVESPLQYKMHKAVNMMANLVGPGQYRYRTTSRIYEILKKSVEVPIEVREKMSVSQKERFKTQNGTFLGKIHSLETRKKMSESASKPKSLAWKLSASKNRKGRQAPNKGIPQSEETKKKISIASKGERNGFFGKQHSVEQREKKRLEKLMSPKKICYSCNKEVDAMNYGRWHGDRCKSKK
jgi:hypothetical protein